MGVAPSSHPCAAVTPLLFALQVIKLVAAIDPKTKAKTKAKYVKSGAICIARISVDKPICLEAFDVVPQLGRFTLRDEGRTIAIGKVTRVPKKGAATPAE